VIPHLLFFYLYVDFLTNYPLVSRAVADIYGWTLLIGELLFLLLTIREYSNVFTGSDGDQNLFVSFWLMVSLLYAISIVIERGKNRQLMSLNLAEAELYP
jgi:hypothetical protein